jgi:hypothetical protein
MVRQKGQPGEYQICVWRDGKHISTERFRTFDELDERLQGLDWLHSRQNAEYRMQVYVGDKLLGEVTNR